MDRNQKTETETDRNRQKQTEKRKKKTETDKTAKKIDTVPNIQKQAKTETTHRN